MKLLLSRKRGRLAYSTKFVTWQVFQQIERASVDNDFRIHVGRQG